MSMNHNWNKILKREFISGGWFLSEISGNNLIQETSTIKMTIDRGQLTFLLPNNNKITCYLSNNKMLGT